MDKKVKEKAYRLIEYLRENQYLSLDVSDNKRSTLVDAYLNYPEIASELETYAEVNNFRFLSRKRVLMFVPLLKPLNKLALTQAKLFESLKHTNAFSTSMTKLQVAQRETLAFYCALTLYKQLLDDSHVMTTGNFRGRSVTYHEWVKEVDESLTKAVDREAEASQFTFQDLLDTWQQLQEETESEHPKNINSRHYFLINVVLKKLFVANDLANYLKDDDVIQPSPLLPVYAEYLSSDDVQPVIDDFLEGEPKEENADAKTE